MSFGDPMDRELLVFSNPGDTDILDAGWSLAEAEGESSANVSSDPFPLDRMVPGTELPLTIYRVDSDIAHPAIRTYWTDLSGQKHEQETTVGW